MPDLVPCRSCRKPVRWVETVGGRRMPLDPDPCPEGNVVIGWDGRARFLSRLRQQCRVCGCTPEDACPSLLRLGEGCSWVEYDLCSACVNKEPARYLSHFASCPDARRWSGKRTAAAVRRVLKATERARAEGRTAGEDLKAKR